MAGPDAAEQHRRTAGRFSELVVAVPADRWDSPAPVPGWTARDVVGHLIDWSSGLFGAVVPIERGPAVADDPVAAWRVHAAAVQGVLDDPVAAAAVLRNPHLGELPLATAIDRIYTTDVFLHGWDLARATGQDPALDEARCAELLAGMTPVEEMLRASGQYGPRVDVPDDAPVADRLMGFLGRDPRA